MLPGASTVQPLLRPDRPPKETDILSGRPLNFFFSSSQAKCRVATKSCKDPQNTPSYPFIPKWAPTRAAFLESFLVFFLERSSENRFYDLLLWSNLLFYNPYSHSGVLSLQRTPWNALKSMRVHAHTHTHTLTPWLAEDLFRRNRCNELQVLQRAQRSTQSGTVLAKILIHQYKSKLTKN